MIYTANINSIIKLGKKKYCEMDSNTERHRLARCRFSLHKSQLDAVASSTETVDFWHESLVNRTAPPFNSDLNSAFIELPHIRDVLDVDSIPVPSTPCKAFDHLEMTVWQVP